MAEPNVTPPQPEPDRKSVGELVFDVSERASTLIREEIELAKTEVSEKVGSLLRGSVVGVVAGTFAFLALILAMHGIAWVISEAFFDDKVWPGYFIEAALFLLIAALAGLVAYRAVQKGAPPMPEQAIEEAKRTREMLGGDSAAGPQGDASAAVGGGVAAAPAESGAAQAAASARATDGADDEHPA